MDVLVYGSIGYDILTFISEMPLPGKDADVIAEERHLGGEACNVAVALARWGIESAIGGNRIANDEGGAFIRQKLAKEGVDISQIKLCTKAPTPFCRILVAPGGERFILSYGHKTARFTLPDNTLLRSSRILVTDRFGGKARDALTGVAKMFGAIVISTDVTPDETIRSKNSDVIITSKHFVENTLGETNAAAFLEKMQTISRGTIIVTRGADPVMFSSENGEISEVDVPPVERVTDTTGAGDTFTAGIAYGMLKGWKMEECVRFAAAAASLSVTRRGADNPPSLEEVLSITRG